MRILGDLRFWTLAAVAATVVSAAFEPRLGAGFALGVFATSFSLVALWLIIRLLGASIAGEDSSRLGATLVIVAFLIKLPLLYGCWMLANSLGDPAPTLFLLGMALVYCAMVGWAQVRNQSPP